MTRYQAIKTALTDKQFALFVAIGVIPKREQLYVDIYEFWREHGKSQTATSAAFNLSPSQIGYIVRKMKQQII